ncbi:DNA-binding protein [Chryseobacterium shigense]|uniref:Helix-turn-helix n=1 Tax=Chryseobacterium shigense TaxID=297244 RepID=A0A1N7IFI9_9FLAO|nr:helix-turn-helix domain-containing protein [Chryseobacterium shigense]PQA94462.1 DNA-binding protein [Chryseobacterium shigense]SIS35820.1 Helix-turn-helix [Chryseobacterium shigense]
MSKLKEIREKKNLTQEELAESSGISVRTIQRIEAGTQPKGHTLRVLAKALETTESEFQNVEIETKDPEIKEDQIPANYSLIKVINLSSIPCMFLPPLNILVPLFLMFKLKQKNALVKQIISVQIIWTILAPVTFLLGIFLKPGPALTIIIIILIFLSNIFIILRNSAEIDRNKELFYKLNFSLL